MIFTFLTRKSQSVGSLIVLSQDDNDADNNILTFTIDYIFAIFRHEDFNLKLCDRNLALSDDNDNLRRFQERVGIQQFW